MNSKITIFRDHGRAFPALSGALQRHPVAVESGKGLLHHSGRMWLKKLVQQQKERKTQLTTWNIRTLTGKSMELVNVMKRRRVSVAYLQETKWKRDKAKELANGYKLFYAGKNTTKNGVGIVVDKDLKEKIVWVKRLRDRIIAIKLVFKEDRIHIISAYMLPKQD